jgi:triosephosphate isomerase
MLVDIGCTHVILAQRARHGMGETDAVVNAQLRAALTIGLIPIVCLGETKDQRLADQTEEVLLAQLTGSLAGVTPEQMAGTILAYEPVWAIGTGLTATPEQAQAAHHFIRSWLKGNFGEATAARVIVQYGGSVKPDNAAELWHARTSTVLAGGKLESRRLSPYSRGPRRDPTQVSLITKRKGL